jgi:putative ABC transport system ATP-binding protein
VNEPEVVLADEPTGNLDSKTSLEIVNIFQQLNESGLTVIMVTHELYMARFCKRILVVRDGLLVRDEAVNDRLRAPDELLVVKQEEEAARLIAAS